MTANYHTHTPRCNHACGSERDYVEAALAAGLTILGFSDHSPYIFPGGYYSRFRMKPEQYPDYISVIRSLQEEYQDRIQIHAGLEMEYYPRWLPDLLPLLRDFPLDYLILGQHFLGDEIGQHYSGHATADKKHLEQFCSQTIDAMHSGLFTCFAHPDVLNYVGDDASFYRRQIRRLCREAKQCRMPLEINLLGMLESKHYPNPRFWEIAAEEGCDVILGRDAHAPEQLLMKEYEQRGLDIVKRYGLHLLDTVPLRKPL